MEAQCGRSGLAPFAILARKGRNKSALDLRCWFAILARKGRNKSALDLRCWFAILARKGRSKSALDLRCWFAILARKGRNSLAQGNALGAVVPRRKPEPCKGETSPDQSHKYRSSNSIP